MHSFSNVQIENQFLLAFYQRDFIAVIFYPNIWKMNTSIPAALLKGINGSIF